MVCRFSGHGKPVFIIFLFLTSVSLYAFSIDSVIARSDSCVLVEWTPDSNNTSAAWYLNNGLKCTGTDSIYRKCDFSPGLTYHGVAYSYGGEDPWYIFRDKLEQGFPAGSHQCHYNSYGDPSDTIAGTDCSGFLSFAWNYPRSSTSMLYSDSNLQTVPFSHLQPGDALVMASSGCGYHAVLVIESESLSETVIAEASSSVFGCRERVVDLNQQYWNCYKALRYPGLTSIKKEKQQTDKIQLTSIKRSGNGKNYRISFSSPFSGSAGIYNAIGKSICRKDLESANSFTFSSTGSGTVSILKLVSKKGVTRSFVIPFL